MPPGSFERWEWSDGDGKAACEYAIERSSELDRRWGTEDRRHMGIGSYDPDLGGFCAHDARQGR
jgi:hypothetical protein